MSMIYVYTIKKENMVKKTKSKFKKLSIIVVCLSIIFTMCLSTVSTTFAQNSENTTTIEDVPETMQVDVGANGDVDKKAKVDEIDESVSDEAMYNIVYLLKHGNNEYADFSKLDLGAFLSPVAISRGVATYNHSKEKEWSFSEGNSIASMTYELPIYDIDENSDYYVAIPNVCLGDENIGSYDFAIAYNNDNADLIEDYIFEDEIVYIKKSVIDNPQNKYPLSNEDVLLAMQLNYYFKSSDIGRDDAYSKSIPVQIYDAENEKYLNKTVKVENIFADESVSFPIGDYDVSQLSVNVNGISIPLLKGMYDVSDGVFTLYSSGGVVSSINISINEKSLLSKIKDAFLNDADAVTAEDAKYYHNEDNKMVYLGLELDDIFVGWRGYYKARTAIFNCPTSNVSKVRAFGEKVRNQPEWVNSQKYLYGAKTSRTSARKPSNGYWALASYTKGQFINKKAKYISANTVYKGLRTSNKRTMYNFFKAYADSLEAAGEGYGVDGNRMERNNIGGYNNFSVPFPQPSTGSKHSYIYGSDTRLVSKDSPDYGKKQERITFDATRKNGTKAIKAGAAFAGSCAHINESIQEGTDDKGKRTVYVACLAKGEPKDGNPGYVVLTFAIRGISSQESLSVYKFAVDNPVGKVQVKKESLDPEISSDFKTYSFENAEFKLYEGEAESEVSEDDNDEDAVADTDYSNLTIDQLKSEIIESLTDDNTSDENIVPDQEAGESNDAYKQRLIDFLNSLNLDESGEDVPPLPEDPDDKVVRDTENKKVVLITDKNGVSNKSGDVSIGDNYYLFETKAPDGYEQLSDKIPVEIEEEEVKTVTFKDPAKSGMFTFNKNDFHTGLNAQGNASIKGAEFTVKYFDAYSKNDIDEDKPKKIYKLKSIDDTGLIAFKKEYKASGSAEIPRDHNKEDRAPLGTYIITESKEPVGYTKSSNKLTIKVKEEQNGVEITKSADTIYNDVKRFGIKLHKASNGYSKDSQRSTPTGNTSLQNAQFTITNKSEKSVLVRDVDFLSSSSPSVNWHDSKDEKTIPSGAKKVESGSVVGTMATDANGNSQTLNNDLPYGTYTIKESKPPVGHNMNDGMWEFTIHVYNDSNGNDKARITGKNNSYGTVDQTIDFSNNMIIDLSSLQDKAKNDKINSPKRFGIKLKKVDNDLYKNQGNAEFTNTEFTLVNKSPNYVNTRNTNNLSNLNESVVDWSVLKYELGSNAKQVESNGIMGKLYTGSDGITQTRNDDLTYGTYYIEESKSPIGYGENGTWNIVVRCYHDNASDKDYINITGTDNDMGSINKTVEFTDKMIVDLTEYETLEPIKRFGVKFTKKDNDLSQAVPQGDASLENAEYTIWNKSKNPVAVRNAEFLSDQNPFVNWSILKQELPNGSKEVAKEAEVGKLKTKANGSTTTYYGTDLPYGTYTIKETKASKGYNLNEKWVINLHCYHDSTSDKDYVKVTGKNNDDGEIDVTLDFSHGMIIDLDSLKDKQNKPVMAREAVKRSGITIVKIDKALQEQGQRKSEALGGAYLEDIIFTIKNQSAMPVVVRDDPYSIKVERNAFYRDYKFIMDDSKFDFSKSEILSTKKPGKVIDWKTLSADEKTKLFESGDIKIVNKGGEIGKIVSHWNPDYVNPDGSKGAYTAETRIDDLPYGTYTIQETTTNDSYERTDNKPHTFSVTEEGVQYDENNSDVFIFSNYPYRAPLEIHKEIEEEFAEDMYIPFKITLIRDGKPLESHVMVTDANGNASTFDTRTNAEKNADEDADTSTIINPFDDLLSYDGVITSEMIKKRSKQLKMPIWFEKGEFGSIHEYDPKKGGLSYGKYVIDELPCEANEGMGLVEEYPLDFTIQGGVQGVYITDYADPITGVFMGANFNKDLRNIRDFPEIGTTAKVNGHSTALASSNTVLKDTVSLKDLEKSSKYKLVGRLIDKDANEPIKDKDGKILTVEKEFNGNTEEEVLEFTFDASNLAGHDIVAFERLYVYNENKKVWENPGEGGSPVVHEDITDEGQTIHIPDAETTAATEEGKKEFAISEEEEVTMVDTIRYTNLTPGEKYSATGYLFDADTLTALTEEGTKKEKRVNDKTETIKNDDGSITVKTLYATKSFSTIDGENIDIDKLEDLDKAIKSTVEFTPEERNGEVKVEFKFKKPALMGTRIVTFEDVRSTPPDGPEYRVAVHAQWDDESQITYIPEIGTKASVDGKNANVRPNKDITLIDTISYENLEPGKEHTVKGTLIDKSTKQPAKDSDGKEITAEAKFVPETPTGTVDMTFTFNGKFLHGQGLVAFEKVFDAEGRLVASHEDLEDKDQTVTFEELKPQYDMYKIRTTKAPSKGDKFGFFVNDNVEYEVHVKNTGNIETTMDVKDKFIEGSEYFTVPKVKDVKFNGEGSWNNMGKDEYVSNITVESGAEAIVTYEAQVTPEAKKYLAKAAADSDSKDENNKDVNMTDQKNSPDMKDGYKNEASCENVTYPDPKTRERKPIEPKKDIAQTPVQEPKIGTYLTDEAKNKQIVLSDKVKLVDTVKYEGLKPGKWYVFEGTLIQKDTSDPLVENGKPVVAYSDPFKAEKSSGTAKVVFTVNLEGFMGKELVAFENAYVIKDYNKNKKLPELEKTLIASHADLKDKDQTVKVSMMDLYVNIAKADKDKIHYFLKGAEITVFDEKGNIVKDKNGKKCVGITDKNGEVKFTIVYVDGHRYYAQETKAPKGYHINKNKFEVKPKTFDKKGANIQISILDKAIVIPPVVNPKTGDNTMILMILALLLTSVSALIVQRRIKN